MRDVVADDIREELKKILKQYRKMSASVQRRLSKVGITVIEGKNHYKLYFKGNTRRCFSLPKTPSSTRTGVNSAFRIYNHLVLAQA